jgi:hypothetical protein
MNLLASDEPASLEERIDAALEAAGRIWKRREGAWIIPASERLPREIRITALGDHLRVEAILVSWDEIGADEMRALGRLLDRAQSDLRFARCQMDERQARIAAVVESSFLERDLPDALSSVMAGIRLLAREVGVLLMPEMARTYLAFLGGAG